MLQRTMIIGLIAKVTLFVAIQWLARTGGTLAALIASEVIIGSASNVITWLFSRKWLRPAFDFDWGSVWLILQEGLPLFVSSAFILLYIRIDVFFLQYYRSNAEIGIYAAAYRLTESLPLVASALTNSIFPVMCQQIHAVNEVSLNRLLRVSFKLLLGAIIPMALVLVFASGAVTNTLYGNRFVGSAPLLAILACNQLLVYTNVLLTTLLVARGRNVALLWLTLVMLAFNVASNFIVIPQYGATGATVTTCATELVGTMVFLSLTATTNMFVKAVSRLLIPSAICGALLALLVPHDLQATLALAGGIAVALAVYLILVVLLRVFDHEEWVRLKRLAWQ
jgi:O-antigen/teichoic acid export membrane protein